MTPGSKNGFMYNSTILWCFSAALFLLFILPRLLGYGLFLDGLIYSSIARNLAEGVGSLWKPYYTDTSFPVFYEHPPFAFFLQSLFFRIFGQAYFVESMYSAITGLLALGLIALIWRRLPSGDDPLPGAWWPALLFIAFPIVTWIYSNNMLENTMVVFVLLSSLLLLLSIRQDKLVAALLLSALAGLSLFLAVLSKGVNALFPLALPFFWWLVLRDLSFRRMALITLGLAAGFAVSAVLIVGIHAEAVSFTKAYFQSQLFKSLKGERETADRFSLLNKWFQESLAPWAFCLIALIWKRKKINFKNRTGLFWMCIALSGSLPLLISPKQMGWYLLPSLPFLAMAYAAFFGQSAKAAEICILSSRRGVRAVQILVVLLLLAGITGMAAGKGAIHRDRGYHHDFITQPFDFAPRTQVSVYPKSLRKNFGLLAYSQRYDKVSITEETGRPYLITNRRFEKDSLLIADYRRVHPDTSMEYVVMEKR